MLNYSFMVKFDYFINTPLAFHHSLPNPLVKFFFMTLFCNVAKLAVLVIF